MAKALNRNSAVQQPRWKRIAVLLLQIAAACVFLLAGGSKLLGVEHMVIVFTKIGFGQWFRYLTGTLEIAGAFLILFPRTAFWGGVLLSCVMLGAVFTHFLLIGGSPVPAIVLLLITATITRLRRSQA